VRGAGARAGLWCGLGALLVAGAFLFHAGGNVTAFFRLGRFAASPLLPANAIVNADEDGYDGQFFLALAYDPLLRDSRTLDSLDNPRYRARRILYPLLGYLLALGRPAAVPWILVVLNLGATALVGALLAAEAGLSSRETLLVLLGAQGLWISLLFSTADLLAVVFLLLALWDLRRGGTALAAVCLLLATLTRETYLAHGAALSIAMALGGHWRRAGALAAGQVPALAWNFWVLSAVSQGNTGFERSLGLPFVGLWRAIADLLATPWSLRWVYAVFSLLVLLATAALAVAALTRHWAGNPEGAVATLPYLVLLSFVAISVLGYYMGYARAFLGLYVLLWLLPAAGRLARMRLALTLLSALGCACFLGYHLFLRPVGPG